MLKKYLKEVADTTIQGDAREESYYSHLKELIESFGKKSLHITILPKKTEAGNPDFRIWDGKQHIVGYIEAKAPGANLNHIETTEQLQRYRHTFPNLILTDFYEFRLYRDGECIDQVVIGRSVLARKVKVAPPVEKEKEFLKLFDRFISFSLPKTFSASSLAVELAKRTRFLRDEVVFEELKEESEGKGAIIGFYEAFKKYLIVGLTKEEFADLYSQTITYGLFAARTRATGSFNRALAYKYIPPTIGILKDVFEFISLGDLPKQMEVTVDDITEVLHVAEINKILHDYYRKGKGKDPIIHFYETFLGEYDPETREKRGVYYTPEPVVKYIVSSIHKLLKSHFNLNDGLASMEVTLLDPAAGTLTFPAEAIKTAVEEYTDKYGKGGKTNLIQKQILNNFHAFELMMAPYAIGHLKISFLLEELGYKLEEKDRFKLYLTNALEMEDIEEVLIPGLSALSEESRLAGKVKKEKRILVILGNPPYSANSANKNEWTEKLLKTDLDGAQSYYAVDGGPLGERNPKLLQDDYVKFLRFAQWKIHKAGRGIVGIITNHGYLDNSTFRGMRQSLMKTFNEIHILDLHGNSLKKETAPDGSKDENVFDIRQGVSIALFVKQENKSGCKVFHADLYGLRKKKYAWLIKHNIENTKYNRIAPESLWYFFVRRHTKGIEDYLNWPQITEIFPVNSTGIKTHRDNLVIAFSKQELENRILQFRNLSLPDEVIRKTYKLKDSDSWQLAQARKKLADDSDWNTYYQPILYRPFDTRYIHYVSYMIDRPRMEVMKHVLQRENLSLCFMRQYAGGMPYSHFLVSDCLLDNRTFFSSKGTIQYAPLYLYPETDDETFFSSKRTERESNITKSVFKMLKITYGEGLTPEDIFYYIYGIFYSTIFREKYAEFLRIDFPRVPFTKDRKIFRKVAKLGEYLAELHLLESSVLDKPIARYEGIDGNDKIDKLRYQEKDKRIYINNNKWFEGVKPDVWNYYVGGYQVLQKYLKDRKGRRMDDPRTYLRIITAIHETIEIQQKIDNLYPAVEKELIEYKKK